MNWRMLDRLLALFAVFGVFSTPHIPVAHGLVHVEERLLDPAFHHTGALASGLGIGPAGSDHGHDSLHADCILGHPRARLQAVSTSLLATAPACAPLALKPTQKEPIAQVPYREPLSLAVSPLHA